MRILHVDDDPEDSLLLRLALEKAGITAEVTDVPSVAGALAALGDLPTAETYAAVVVDNGLPDGLGATLGLVLRATGVPFVVYTGDPGGVRGAPDVAVISKAKPEELMNWLRRIA